MLYMLAFKYPKRIIQRRPHIVVSSATTLLLTAKWPAAFVLFLEQVPSDRERESYYSLSPCRLFTSLSRFRELFFHIPACFSLDKGEHMISLESIYTELLSFSPPVTLSSSVSPFILSLTHDGQCGIQKC
jgi:hypothetical protein